MSRGKKFNITILLVFTLLCLTAMGAEVFFYQKLMEIQSNVAEQKYRIEKIADREKILFNLSKNYEKVDDSVNLIGTALPDKKDSSRLLSDLDSLAKDSGLKLLLLASDNTAKKGVSNSDPSLLQTINGKYSQELPLNLSVEGTYPNFQKFLIKVENYQRLLNISSVDIVQSPDEKNTDIIEAKIKLTAYLKK